MKRTAEDILDSVVAQLSSINLPAGARVEAARLAEAWITETSQFDLQHPTLAVELPFFFFADKFTVIVGVTDRMAIHAESGRLFGSEWKTTKGKTKFWNENKWLDKIKTGAQIAIYALAQKQGYYLARYPGQTHEPDLKLLGKYGEIISPDIGSEFVLWRPKVKDPMVMVRAITKEHPPAIWPSEGQAFIEFEREKLMATLNALINKGASLRAMKGTELAPYQLPGLQCENRFSHTMCQFHEECTNSENLDRLVSIADNEEGPNFGTDPGAHALGAAEAMLRVKLSDPRVVVLSSSSYEDVSNCAEFWRLATEGHVAIDHYYQNELDIGTGLHAAVGTYLEEASKNVETDD